MEKRVIETEEKKGLSLSELLLTAVLLAAGAVLKFFVGTFINFFGMKPNFIIAMYCLIIALLRPKIWYSIIVGLLAGAICQFFPGTAGLNFASEFAGALCMGLLIMIPAKNKEDEIMLLRQLIASDVLSYDSYKILIDRFTKWYYANGVPAIEE